MKNIFSTEEIIRLGFQLYDAGDIDENGSFYEVYVYWQYGSRLEVTFEFSKDGNVTNSYVEFESIKLLGVDVNREQIQLLIKLIYNDEI